jgi:uncharacterized protein YjbI with pentapeptide repeats
MTERGQHNRSSAGGTDMSLSGTAPSAVAVEDKDTLRTLRTECKKGARGRPRNLDLSTRNFAGEDLSGLDLSGFDFRQANLVGVNLAGSNLGWSNLAGANLQKANLKDSELVGADLSGANLAECCAERAGLGATNLAGATMIGADLRHATLTEASLSGADLRAAVLEGCNIRNANLRGTTFTRADLRGADLQDSDVGGASFEMANLQRARLLGIMNYTSTNWIGTDVRELDLRGAYLIKRFISDENYLYEFRTRSRYHGVLYKLWWLTSDCGRSLLRWTMWVAAVTVAFAMVYTAMDLDYGPYQTAFSPLYYSVVTLTTLGYGDVVPASGHAQAVASLQTVLGYVGLGGFLSILANKMARRAE